MRVSDILMSYLFSVRRNIEFIFVLFIDRVRKHTWCPERRMKSWTYAQGQVGLGSEKQRAVHSVVTRASIISAGACFRLSSCVVTAPARRLRQVSVECETCNVRSCTGNHCRSDSPCHRRHAPPLSPTPPPLPPPSHSRSFCNSFITDSSRVHFADVWLIETRLYLSSCSLHFLGFVYYLPRNREERRLQAARHKRLQSNHAFCSTFLADTSIKTPLCELAVVYTHMHGFQYNNYHRRIVNVTVWRLNVRSYDALNEAVTLFHVNIVFKFTNARLLSIHFDFARRSLKVMQHIIN